MRESGVRHQTRSDWTKTGVRLRASETVSGVYEADQNPEGTKDKRARNCERNAAQSELKAEKRRCKERKTKAAAAKNSRRRSKTRDRPKREEKRERRIKRRRRHDSRRGPPRMECCDQQQVRVKKQSKNTTGPAKRERGQRGSKKREPST